MKNKQHYHNRFFIGTILGVFIICLQSCASKKKIEYFQDISRINQTEQTNTYDPVVRPNDLLAITVSAYDLDAVRPFNLPYAQVSTGLEEGSMRQQLQSYLVDREGNIEFPVVGTIKVAGLKRQQVTELLKAKVEEYVKDPIVNIRVLNFKVTVMGEVMKPGTYTIPDERITVLEALGLAGDLTIHGRRDNVRVIREQDGNKSYETIDLRKSDLFESPYYYLKQNDVVVVSPNGAQVQNSSFNRNLTILVPLASVILSIIAIISRN